MSYTPDELAQADQFLSRISADVTALANGCGVSGYRESLTDVDVVAEGLREFQSSTVLVMCAIALIRLGREKEIRDKLVDHLSVERQAFRQIDLFLTDGERSHLIVAQAILDPKAELERRCGGRCGDLRHPDGCESVGPLDEYRGQ